jgi:hypothetical protein
MERFLILLGTVGVVKLIAHYWNGLIKNVANPSPLGCNVLRVDAERMMV